MTENNNNNQTMSLEDITRALGELAKHVEAIRGGENAPELDPDDPLNEILPTNYEVFDATCEEISDAHNHLGASGEPRTIRNFLKALMQGDDPDSFYTATAPTTGKRYRICQVSARYYTAPDGSRRTTAYLRPAPDMPVPPEELVPGWKLDGNVEVLEVFELRGKKCALLEQM